MYTDSPEFLAIPASYADTRSTSRWPQRPRRDFGVIRGPNPVFSVRTVRIQNRRHMGWLRRRHPRSGRLHYFSIGDHRSYGGNAYIFRYDPKTKTHRAVVDLRKAVGWTPRDYADSKIHGDLDMSPDGDMWFLTYFGPFPTKKEWDTVYRGSLLFHYNIRTEAETASRRPVAVLQLGLKRGTFFASPRRRRRVRL